tara:strand:- start:168 stop:416 length:249 start_codon:yes stop_codon:yes gene_type:complete
MYKGNKKLKTTTIAVTNFTSIVVVFSFSHINQVWTSEGIESVKPLQHLIEIIKSLKVEGISFSGHYQSASFGEAMSIGDGLD